jgi:hypothetical protein
MASIELADRAAARRDDDDDDDDVPSTSAATASRDDDIERGWLDRDTTEDDDKSSIDGLNEDGYFGNADGAWIASDRVPLVLRTEEERVRRERANAATSLREDVELLCAQWGWLLVAGAFCVGLLLAVLWFFVLEVEPGHPGVR